MTKEKELAAAARGEGCLGRSQDDEPLFILCARDVLAVDVVDDWIKRAEHAGVPDAKLNDARRLKMAMREWRETHGGGKVPD